VIQKYFKNISHAAKQTGSIARRFFNRGGHSDQDENIVLTGRHSYGLHYIKTHAFGEGRKLYIGSFNSIAGGQNVFLGGDHCTAWSSAYPFGHRLLQTFPAGLKSRAKFPLSKGDVVIENDIWIGAFCTIMSGVKIGSGSILAAGSLVTKDVPPYVVVGGNPARIIKQRFKDSIVAELLDLAWWNLDDQTIDRIIPLLQQPPTSARLAEMRRISCQQ